MNSIFVPIILHCALWTGLFLFRHDRRERSLDYWAAEVGITGALAIWAGYGLFLLIGRWVS